jgi:hypothetical protein
MPPLRYAAGVQARFQAAADAYAVLGDAGEALGAF